MNSKQKLDRFNDVDKADIWSVCFDELSGKMDVMLGISSTISQAPVRAAVQAAPVPVSHQAANPPVRRVMMSHN